jgi:hypothetical protein
LVANQANTHNYALVRGDGSGFLGFNGTGQTITYGAAGNVTIATPSSGDALNIQGTTTVGGNVGGNSTAFAYTIGANPQASFSAGGFIQLFGSTAAPASSLLLGTNASTRVTINSTGNVGINAPNSGIALAVAGVGNNAAVNVVTGGTAPNGLIAYGFTNSTSVVQGAVMVDTANTYFGSISNHGARFFTNNINQMTITAAGLVNFANAIGVNGKGAPAVVGGFGTPTGFAVINNFPGASATLVQCSTAIARLIVDLQNIGFYNI